jgi:PAS domain S-box-containing protein
MQKDTEGRLIFDLGNRQWNIPRLRDLLEEITRHNTRVDDFEVTHHFPQLGQRTMIVNARRIEQHPGQQMIFLSIIDVTEQLTRVESLKRHAALLELAQDAVIVRNLEGKIEFWNHGAETLYGWTKQETVGKTTSELLKTRFPKSFDQVKTELLKTGHWEGELVHARKNGDERVVESRWALQNSDSKNPVILEINTDITERKQSQESLRQLSSYLMRVQDEERRRIARELHDSTGQKLVALKMNLASIARDGASKKTNGDSLSLVDEALHEIRSLAQLLHPPLLDEAGLASATKWLVDGFAERSGIGIDLNFDSGAARLPNAVELALFRVIQESLNNIHRHSAAKKAKIRLLSDGTAVTLEISDDGKGMPSEMMNHSPKSKPTIGVGILGMKERLSQLGGTLEIAAGKKGTTIKAVVPFRSEKE